MKPPTAANAGADDPASAAHAARAARGPRVALAGRVDRADGSVVHVPAGIAGQPGGVASGGTTGRRRASVANGPSRSRCPR